MNLVWSLALAVVFAAGTYLILKRDLIRVFIGIMTLSNAAILFLIAASYNIGQAPIEPVRDIHEASDPLTQALVLTAVVINFGTSGLVLSLLWKLHSAQHVLDREVLKEEESETVQEHDTSEDEL